MRLSLIVSMLAAFASGWNERFEDPSLTAAQICVAQLVAAVPARDAVPPG